MGHLASLLTLFLGIGTPGSPELLAPPDQAVMTGTEVAQAVTFTWRPTTGVASYRLRIATAPDFKQPIIDRTTSNTSEVVRGMKAGRYFWKVTVTDGGGTDVATSTTGRVILQ